MKNSLTVIVLAYNRSHALSNLFDSLLRIKTNGESINLIISIDNRGTNDVNRIANEFVWPFGDKRVIIHEKRLGLKAHFMYSGDITEEFENVIFLEDDLVVSPYLLDFCDAYLDHYMDDDRITGASLYNPILKEGTGCKYYQIEDGSDVYFLQQPYWGNIWTKSKWRLFKEWLKTYKLNNSILPKHVATWKDSSFKKVFIQYLIETDRYFVTPRLSLLTNNGEAGLHNTIAKYQYQCNMVMGHKQYNMPSLDDSKSLYDAFFEIKPEILKKENSELAKYNFYVDIYKQKPLDSTDMYCLTTRECNNPILKFNIQMKPIELAAMLGAKGDGLFLVESKNILKKEYDRGRLLFDDIISNYMIDFKAASLLIYMKIKEKLVAFTNGKN